MSHAVRLPVTALLGFGTMGRALATGLLAQGLATPRSLRVGARRPDAAQAHAEALGLVARHPEEAARGAEILVLAVKPRDVDGLLCRLEESDALDHHPLVISIAAGVRTASLAERAPGCAIVRAMPNTPCAIGKGVTVVCAGPGAETRHLELAQRIFGCMGAVLQLDEKHMDTVTGLGGSGPAFIYLVLEAMAEGAVMRGMPRAVALELAARVALGASEMLLATGRHPASLRDDVTTPAGCTIAGLLALEDGRIRSVLARGVETAGRVAGELAS